MSKIIKAADFGSRDELDAFLLRIPSAEKDTSWIEGTQIEMAQKHLSNTTRVHGVPCRITDPVVGSKVQPPPDRGPIKKFGIVGQELRDKPEPRTRAARRPGKKTAKRVPARKPKRSIKKSGKKTK